MILTGQLHATRHKAHVPLTFDVPAGTTQLVVRFSASPQREPGGVMTAPPPDRTSQLERRKSDRGPPPGQVDRRQPRSFGRRPTH